MAERKQCPDCGTTLGPEAPDGGCPACAFRNALALGGGCPEAVVTEKPGDRIGHYQLQEQIGEGGYGTVYLAEQAEPIRRKVALKVIKLGMDTKQVIARFEAERQALALMDHPNIARVLDAGATDSGRPFFVMELVLGLRITDYCDRHNLSTRERLDLFMQVCHAVQHAHQKGIIHRDLKPSNILVAELEGKPVPKVIDFGIAKATGGQTLTDKTVSTAVAQFIGTPAYMSPEQAGLRDTDIDTRSDIYSLGVLLYELLTSRLPFEQKEMWQAGVDEMRRMIREKEPVKPSTRLNFLAAADLTTVARRHGTEPPKLVHLVRGDLDWIVMKCLEKERSRRYETPNSLACDVGRHLDSQPVEARPPSQLYRLGKLVRRNKLALTAAVAVFAALAIGLGFSLWSLRKARQEASRSEQVARFLGEMLQGVGPSVALGRDTTILREILDRTAQRLDKDLKDQPEVEADLRNLMGTVYGELGQFEKAEAAHRRALALKRLAADKDNLNTAVSLSNLAGVLAREGKLKEAETVGREALTLRKRLRGDEHVETAMSLNNLGTVLWRQGNQTDAEACYRQALGIYRRILPADDHRVAAVLGNLGTLLVLQGKPLEAETMLREALALQTKLLSDEHPTTLQSLGNLANVLNQQGKLVEAEDLLRKVIALRRKLLNNEHPELAISLYNLASMLAQAGKLEEAEALDREALAMRKKLLDREHPDVVRSLGHLGLVLQAQNKLAEAEDVAREHLTILEKTHPHEWRTFDAQRLLGSVLLDQKKYGEAEPLLLSGYAGMAQCEDRIPAEHKPRLKEALQCLVQLYEATGKPEQAAK